MVANFLAEKDLCFRRLQLMVAYTNDAQDVMSAPFEKEIVTAHKIFGRNVEPGLRPRAASSGHSYGKYNAAGSSV